MRSDVGDLFEMSELPTQTDVRMEPAGTGAG